MIDRPVWFYTVGLALEIGKSEVGETVERECDVKETAGFWVSGPNIGHGDDCNSVMLVVVAEERNIIVLMADICREEGFVKVDHLFKV